MNAYQRQRFPTGINSYATWFYYRFDLSHRWCAVPFIDDLLAKTTDAIKTFQDTKETPAQEMLQ